MTLAEALALVESQKGVIASKDEVIKTLTWLGSVIVGGLSTAVLVLWNANKKNTEYIRDQDKANLSLLGELGKNHQIMGIDISKIEVMNSKEIIPVLQEIKNKFDNFIDSYLKKHE